MDSLLQDSSQIRQEMNLSFLYGSMDVIELKRELNNLKELHNLGFIQSFEYEKRKQEVELSLKSTSGSPSGKGKKKGKRKERVIRLFLSSTFRDMQSERDELVKFTFPELKQICTSRGIFFTEIDLR